MDRCQATKKISIRHNLGRGDLNTLDLATGPRRFQLSHHNELVGHESYLREENFSELAPDLRT